MKMKGIMSFKRVAMLCLCLYCIPSNGYAVDRIVYELSGTWQTIDYDGLDFDGSSFYFRFVLNADDTPTHFGNRLNVGRYDAPHAASLYIDGAPVPLVDPFVTLEDASVPGEPDRFTLGASEDRPTPHPRIFLYNTIELDSNAFFGTNPQHFTVEEVTHIKDVTYSLDPNCAIGDLCPGGWLEVDYRIENGIAVGILVPEPASILLGFAFFALLMTARSRSDERQSSI